jgi:hypothetical protein
MAYEVWLVFDVGERVLDCLVEDAFDPDLAIHDYAFKTEAERDAFLLGVNTTAEHVPFVEDGDITSFLKLEEARDYVRQEYDRLQEEEASEQGPAPAPKAPE